MLNLINFLTLLFWVCTFVFLLNSKNLASIILYSEIMWVVLYSYTVVIGTINDDLILSSTSFFLLALAGLEFCIGFLITIFFRNFKKSLELNPQSDFNHNFDNLQPKSNSNLNRFIWSFI